MKTRLTQLAAIMVAFGVTATAHSVEKTEKQRIKLTVKTVSLPKGHQFMPAKAGAGHSLKAPKIMQSSAHISADGALLKNCNDISHRHKDGLLVDKDIKEVR